MIETPCTIADLPRDPTDSSRHVFTGDVHSITDSKKRKRAEIAVATDHQGVNIYNVQHSKLVSSYAISPQVIFTCPPCSIRHRKQGSSPSRRHTYCSVKTPESQLICFSETSPTHSDPISTTSGTSIKLNIESPVVALDTINVFGDDHDKVMSSDLVAIHENGTVSCYSQDLGTEKWSTQSSLTRSPTVNIRVEHAAVVSLEQARQTVLRNRDDITASSSLENAGGMRGSLLMLTVRFAGKETNREHGSLNLQLFNIEPQYSENRNLIGSTAKPAKELILLPIPEPEDFSSQSSTFRFHVPTGTMYQTAGGQLAIYDFTGSVPRQVHLMNQDRNTTASYLRVSANLLICSSANALLLLDVPYLSLQAQIDMKRPRESKAQSDEGNSATAFKLVSFDASLDLAIALDGHKLLTIQLSTRRWQLKGSERKRKRDGLLVDSIGRGYASLIKSASDPITSTHKIKPLGCYLPRPSDDDTWNNSVAELRRTSSELNTEGFEKAAFSLLGWKIGDGEGQMRKSPQYSNLDQRKVHCILGHMFSLTRRKNEGGIETDDAQNDLNIRIFPRVICEALMQNGLLNTKTVESSLRAFGVLSKDSKLAPGAFIQALAEWDTPLELLSVLSNSSTPLSSSELVHVLAIVTRDSGAAHSADNSKLLMNHEEGEDDHEQMLLTNGEISHDSSSAVASNSVQTRTILTNVLRKLYIVPSASVVRALRSILSTTQLRVLVDTLRIEIARSGWLSPYEDSIEAVNGEQQDNDQICYIAHVLNCAIDSIGAGGWVIDSYITDGFTEASDTIAYMKAEISAALEGIEEATYLKGMLGDILLCGKNSLHPQVKTAKSDENNVIAKPFAVALNEISNALPLGLKPAQTLSISKVGAGGEVIKRSARDIGRQKSRMVGKYSFERIAI